MKSSTEREVVSESAGRRPNPGRGLAGMARGRDWIDWMTVRQTGQTQSLNHQAEPQTVERIFLAR